MPTFSTLFDIDLSAILSHLPVFVALIVTPNHLFSPGSSSPPKADDRLQRSRERAIDHELLHIRNAVEVLGMVEMRVKVAPSFLNGALVEDLNLNVDATVPTGNGVEGGRGGVIGDDDRGGGRWDDDDDFFGPRKGPPRCGQRGTNRGRGGSTGNLFFDRGRDISPSLGHPAPAFFAPMFRATDVRPSNAELSKKWDEDDMALSEPNHVDLDCEYRIPANHGGGGAPNPGRSGDVGGTDGVQEEQEEIGREDWHIKLSRTWILKKSRSRLTAWILMAQGMAIQFITSIYSRRVHQSKPILKPTGSKSMKVLRLLQHIKCLHILAGSRDRAKAKRLCPVTTI